MKYGFATFIKSRFPNPVLPKLILPFDKSRDFKTDMEDLWCYLTTTGKVAQRRTEQTGKIKFYRYQDGLAEVLVMSDTHRPRFALISPDRIFRNFETATGRF